MTQSLGRNNFVGTELAVGWLWADRQQKYEKYRTSHLSQLQIRSAQLFYISMMIQLSTFLIPR